MRPRVLRHSTHFAAEVRRHVRWHGVEVIQRCIGRAGRHRPASTPRAEVAGSGSAVCFQPQRAAASMTCNSSRPAALRRAVSSTPDRANRMRCTVCALRESGMRAARRSRGRTSLSPRGPSNAFTSPTSADLSPRVGADRRATSSRPSRASHARRDTWPGSGSVGFQRFSDRMPTGCRAPRAVAG
jgi:hypothetical protein